MSVLPPNKTPVLIKWGQSEPSLPEILLYDPYNQEYQRRPIQLGEDLSLDFSPERYCIGHFSTPNEFEPCPMKAQASSGEQCDNCQTADFYWPMRAEYSDLKEIDPHYADPYVVYLATFGPEPKVGITHSDRFPTRVIEQGVDMATVLLEASSIDEALKIERRIASVTSITDQMPKSRKTGLLRQQPDIQNYKDAYQNIVSTLDQELLPFNPTDYTEHYPGDDSYDNRYSLVDSGPVTGTIEGVRGQLILLDSGQALNISGHSGYIVKEREQTGLNQF